MPKKISRMCSSFLDLGVQITAVVTGRRRYSSDLVQGGLEIPCDLRFTGHQQHIEKLKRIIKLKKALKSCNKLVQCLIYLSLNVHCVLHI